MAKGTLKISGADSLLASDLAPNSVNTSELVADAVTGAEIADNAIDSEHYTDGSIDNAHIADDAIDSEHYAAGSIDNAHIADDAIDSEHYAAGSIDEAHIAADAVNFATHLKAGTDGELITWDTSGNPVAVAVGTSGQVLTSSGAGAVPAFSAFLPKRIASGSVSVRPSADAWTTLYTFTPSAGDMYLINGIHSGNTYMTWVLSYGSESGSVWALGSSIHQSGPPYMQGQMVTNALQAKTTFGGTGSTYTFFYSITQVKT